MDDVADRPEDMGRVEGEGDGGANANEEGGSNDELESLRCLLWRAATEGLVAYVRGAVALSKDKLVSNTAAGGIVEVAGVGGQMYTSN